MSLPLRKFTALLASALPDSPTEGIAVRSNRRILQDLFSKLWERRETLLVVHLEAYLFTALKYAIVKHIRSKMVRKRYAQYALLHHSDEGHSTEEDISLHDLTLALTQSLDALPGKTREIFRLNRLEYKR
jgi:RNA polymerase sigma-70 factor (ECF subfamily)